MGQKSHKAPQDRRNQPQSQGRRAAEEGEGGRRSHQDVGNGPHQRDAVEVEGRQRGGADGGPQAGGQGTADEPPQGVPPRWEEGEDPRGEHQQPYHGGKGQLQSHPGDGEGIGEQQHQQRRGQGRQGVALPAQQGPGQDKEHHNAGPDH